MTSPFYTLHFLLGLFCVGLATAKTKEQVRVEQLDLKLANVETELKACINTNCTVGDKLERLEILLQLIRDDIYDLRVDQELMKKDLVSRLKAIEDTLTGNLPTVQTARIEHILANHHRDFRPSINFTDANLPTVHTSCEAAFNAGWTKSGVYRVSPEGSSDTMDVYCEQESELFGGGWTVIQRRLDGTVDFYRTWDQYKNGFGDINGEFWLGNDNIHLLTADRRQMLKVELEHYGSGFAYANYAVFWVNNESQKYQLRVSGYSAGIPDPGDALSFNNERMFTTKDRDNDERIGNCADRDKGGWWYTDCAFANLNGIYGSTVFEEGVVWHKWKKPTEPMRKVRMMIKANENLLEEENPQE